MRHNLTYHLRKFDSRLHRMRIALHNRGIRALLARVRHGLDTPDDAATGADRVTHTPPRGPLRTGARRILLIDVTTPRPDRDSGSVRACNLMKLLVDEGHAVDFLPDDRHDAGAYADALRTMGVAVHDDAAGDTAWLTTHLPDYDLLVISRYHLGSFLIPLARAVSPSTRIVLDTVDLHFLREQREAATRRDRHLARLAAGTRRRELATIAAADAAWVVGTAEHDLLAQALPGARIHVLPNIIEDAPRPLPVAGRAGLLFVGGARHPPNVDAIEWLITDILPRVHATLPGCVLHVVGEGTREVVGNRTDTRIVAHGHVEDLSRLLSQCRVGLAPLRFGAGVKGKVNLYMAHGLPSVLTGCAAESMQLRPGTDALIVDDAAGFAEAVIALYRDDRQWQALSDNGRDSVRRHFSFASARESILATFNDLPPPCASC